MEIISTSQLNQEQRASVDTLFEKCQAFDHTFYQPYLSSSLNFDPRMPAFILAYQKAQLVGLLTMYADDIYPELYIIVDPDMRCQGIGKKVYQRFKNFAPRYGLQRPTFISEAIFIDKHPDFIRNCNLHLSSDREYLLYRDRQMFEGISHTDYSIRLADLGEVTEIAYIQAQAFESHPATSLHYAQTAIADPESSLYLIEEAGRIIGSVTVDHSSSRHHIYGLAVALAYQGKGLAQLLLKATINHLIQTTVKPFEIIVEDQNQIAYQLYQKLGFETKTTKLYLDIL